jgi:nitrogen-specific signal transduction histidine kinase
MPVSACCRKTLPTLEEVREALAEIIDDADRASDVIARVRQLAKRAPVEKSLLDLRDVVQDVLALARYESAARQVTIRTDLPKDLPSVSEIACNSSRFCSTWSSMEWMR